MPQEALDARRGGQAALVLQVLATAAPRDDGGDVDRLARRQQRHLALGHGRILEDLLQEGVVAVLDLLEQHADWRDAVAVTAGQLRLGDEVDNVHLQREVVALHGVLRLGVEVKLRRVAPRDGGDLACVVVEHVVHVGVGGAAVRHDDLTVVRHVAPLDLDVVARVDHFERAVGHQIGVVEHGAGCGGIVARVGALGKVDGRLLHAAGAQAAPAKTATAVVQSFNFHAQPQNEGARWTEAGAQTSSLVKAGRRGAKLGRPTGR
eukprot:356647-Chlamydomonas_euryale.AAC.7